MEIKRNELDIIKWAEVSRILTKNNHRNQITADYNGKKYRKKVLGLKRLMHFWYKWQLKQ